MNLILIGFMGSGKSSAAKALARLLGMQNVEMDEIVYRKTDSRNMHEVFEKGGELLLRETEIEIAKEYAGKQNLVVSTGGGVVLNKIILDYFKSQGGKVIFLQTAFDTLAKRLQGDGARPLFKNLESARKLYDFRMSLYLAYADEIVETDSFSADEIAAEIISRIQP